MPPNVDVEVDVGVDVVQKQGTTEKNTMRALWMEGKSTHLHHHHQHPARATSGRTIYEANLVDGMGDTAKAETWIRSMKRIFNFLRCTDKERMSCVTLQLTGLNNFRW